MEATIITTATITINGITYTFDDPHDAIGIIQQIKNQKEEIAQYQTRIAVAQVQLDEFQSQLDAICTAEGTQQ